MLSAVQSQITDNEWINDNLVRAIKQTIRQKEESLRQLSLLGNRVFINKARALKTQETGDEYRDMFNKLTCQKADELNISLPEAQKIIEEQIKKTTTNSELLETLEEEYMRLELSSLERSAQRAAILFPECSQKAISYTQLVYELNKRQTDKFWGGKKLDDIIVQGLQGKPIELMTILCTINEFNDNGEFTLRPDLDAYKQNPKLEPIPLILDELVKINEIFAAAGISSSLTILIADTDYTQINQFGPRTDTNDRNLEIFIQNMAEYVSKNANVAVLPASEITDGNKIFEFARDEISKLVTQLNDYDFVRIWGRRYEAAVDGMAEALGKRKLYPQSEIRKMATQTIRRIWANNGAQGAMLADLYQAKSNIIFLSTERRERDLNYTILPMIEPDLPPIIYVLDSARSWNTKIINKET